MCGIFGCAARSDVTERLLEGLRRLEYRGYDSAGLAVVSEGELRVVRREGRIERLAEAVAESGVRGETGIGHTRWATHGAPTERNAHPHRDESGDLAVIHNGIIENHDVLRARLEASGHRFASETDSEVLPHLIEEHLAAGADLAEAVRRTVDELRGTFAFVVIDRRRPGVLLGARRDSPLVVGLGEEANYLASDVSALLGVTRRVGYLRDGEVVEATPEGVRVISPDGSERTLEIEEIQWDSESAAKGGYRHFMAKEIDEQPAVVARTLARHAGEGLLEEALGPVAGDLAAADRLSIVACGTSWHAGLVGKFLIESRARLPVDVDYASEFRYRDLVFGERHWVLAVSQSGETLDTLAAVREARAQGARVLSIVNVPGSSLTRESDACILTDAGPEIGVASTKAFTTQLLVLELLSIWLARRRGLWDAPREAAEVEELRRLKVRMEEALETSAHAARAAEGYARCSDFLFLGRGLNYPIALEGALKLKEISYVHAEGYPAGEMKHGPIALVDERMPVVVIATPGRVYEKVLSNMKEVEARGGRIIAVCARGDRRAGALAETVLEVPEVPEELSPLVNVLPLQWLAYWIADLRGCDIDKPRNLAKSVTVE